MDGAYPRAGSRQAVHRLRRDRRLQAVAEAAPHLFARHARQPRRGHLHERLLAVARRKRAPDVPRLLREAEGHHQDKDADKSQRDGLGYSDTRTDRARRRSGNIGRNGAGLAIGGIRGAGRDIVEARRVLHSGNAFQPDSQQQEQPTGKPLSRGVPQRYGGYVGYICRATWRKDGFTSLEAETEGGFTTAPFTFTGGRLKINAWTRFRSEVQVEVLDASEQTNTFAGDIVAVAHSTTAIRSRATSY